MKQILSLILIFLSLNCAAQTINSDSLALRNVKRIDGIQTNLLKFSKEYSTGDLMIGVGIVLAATGGIMLATDSNETPQNTGGSQFNNSENKLSTGLVLVIAGAAVMVFGEIVHLIAHRFIKRAAIAK